MPRIASCSYLPCIAALASLLIIRPAAADWDVTDTGQPYTDARFTVTEGTWMNVDVSPDGRTLLFDLLGDIYSLPAGGGDARLIHGGPAMEHSPRFSPDGTKILYVSDRIGADNVWISNTDGTGARPLSHEMTNSLTTPAWGADGRYIAATRFASTARRKSVEIWLYHIDGGQGRMVVAAPKNGKDVQEPLFSHDGRYLYYTENISVPGGGFLFSNPLQPAFAIKRRDLSDGNVEEVVSGFGGATTAQLSPSDRRLAFIRRVKEKTVLFVYDLQTGEQRPIYDGLERDLHAHMNPGTGSYYPRYAWFPDGRHLAIWSKGKLHRIDVDTQAREEIPFRATAEHRITVPPRFENPLAPERFTVRAIQQIAPSPDGRNVVFNALGRLWHKSLPDGKPRRLTEASAFEFEPSYSADGTHIAYVSWDDERGGALEIATAAGRRVKTLLQGSGILRQPAFSPDGRKLVYWLECGNSKMGGYRATGAGLYWISIAEGQPHYLGSPGGPVVVNPQFSPDGTRIYYLAKVMGFFAANLSNTLESVDLNGLDKRRHVASDETSELGISPDLRWLAYKKDLQYYVIPYRETGTPLILSRAVDAMPVAQLTQASGHRITWSADSSRVYWVSGQSLFGASVGGRASAAATPSITETALNLEVAADRPDGVVAFTNARIITMQEEAKDGDRIIERGSLVVEGNRIVAVGPAEQVAIPKSAKVIDATGKTVMPGLVDMHGHLDVFEDDLLTPQKNPGHYAAVAFGVTTNFDPSATDLPSFASSEMNLAGVTVGPRLISAGKPAFGSDTLGRFHPIGDLDDARRIVAHDKALGAIIIKSYKQPRRSQRQQLIKAAREARVMITPEGEGNLYRNLSMILDGHTSIEHNIPVPAYYDDLIQLLVRGGIALTPTVIVTGGETFAENYFYQTTRPWDDPKIRTFVQRTFSDYSPLGSAPEAPPYARGMVSLHQTDELWDIGFRSVARSLKKLDDAGGIVNTGGHGQIQGLGMHWEMWILGEGGMSSQRILRAATLNGARTIGLDKQIGSLAAGKLADLIVLDANPLENIRNTNTVRYTMVNGRLYDAFTMNEIGNYDRPRTRFYWELQDHRGIDWNEAWGGPGVQSK